MNHNLTNTIIIAIIRDTVTIFYMFFQQQKIKKHEIYSLCYGTYDVNGFWREKCDTAQTVSFNTANSQWLECKAYE
jgi:hypothetical protein